MKLPVYYHSAIKYDVDKMKEHIMYCEFLVFLRFGCYVHSPDDIFTKNRKPIIQWLENIKLDDPETGYKIISDTNTSRSVVSIDVPSSLHTALLDCTGVWIYSDPPIAVINSILASKRNGLKLTKHNLRVFMKYTKSTPAEFVHVMESYLSRIEMNPVQPVDDEELKAIKDLGVRWDLASRLPRFSDGGFDPIYITDEHHRVKCL
jgi:hypothetical protein